MRQHCPCLVLPEPITQDTHRGAPSSGAKDTTKPMTLHVALTHETTYRYDRLIGMGPQIIRLRPAPHCRTPILSYSLTLEPKVHFLNWQQDPFGNFLARVVLPEETRSFLGHGRSRRRHGRHQSVRLLRRRGARRIGRSPTTTVLRKELQPYLEPEPAGPHLEQIPHEHRAASRKSTIDFLCDLNRQLQQDIRISASAWNPACRRRRKRSARPSGSCRDSAWLLVQILRNLGLAARFVSGYLIQLTPDVKALDGPCRRRRPTSPICMPGPKSTFPAPAGSASIRRQACSPAKATFRLPPRRIRRARRRSPALTSKAEVDVRLQHGRHAHPRDPARHEALQRRDVATTSSRAGHTVDERLVKRRCAPQHGRRADVRRRRRHGRRGVEYRRRRPDQAPLCR